MSELLQHRRCAGGSSDSVLAFETSPGGSWPKWDRYLTLNGHRAFHIGNICNTCSFFFQRLGANASVSMDEIVSELNRGISDLAGSTAQAILAKLPAGAYEALLLECVPALVRPNEPGDYFSHEQVVLWGVNAFWNLPHDPRTEYYRLGEHDLGDDARLFEFLVPMFPSNWLGPAVAAHKESLERGHRCTAVSLSVLDVKQPADWAENAEVNTHFALAHYLLDGHHKVFAAYQTGRPLTLLVFLTKDHGLSSESEVRRVVDCLGR